MYDMWPQSKLKDDGWNLSAPDLNFSFMVKAVHFHVNVIPWLSHFNTLQKSQIYFLISMMCSIRKEITE